MSTQKNRNLLKRIGMLAACSLAFGLFPGCRSSAMALPVAGASPQTSQQKQDEMAKEMARLAFLAYVGDKLAGPYAQVEAQLASCMETMLERHGTDWNLAWGPVVYRFPVAELDDNMMYVVSNGANKNELAVVVRGTNPKAVLDWLVEDFDVDDQVSWPYGSGQPKISKGASEGLHILQQMMPADEPGWTLTAFLARQAAAASPRLRVNVTGHSLGGALAPTLALWLHDTRSLWDPEGKADIQVYPLAGPTAGNADFAAYYNSALGPATYRLWNPFDVVPLAWNHESMGKMADLYEPHTRANPGERGLIDGLRSLVKDRGYTQIDPTQTSLSGALYTGKSGRDWAGEAAWQHHCGYECALGINVVAGVKECPTKRPQCDCKDVSTTASR